MSDTIVKQRTFPSVGIRIWLLGLLLIVILRIFVQESTFNSDGETGVLPAAEEIGASPIIP